MSAVTNYQYLTSMAALMTQTSSREKQEEMGWGGVEQGTQRATDRCFVLITTVVLLYLVYS